VTSGATTSVLGQIQTTDNFATQVQAQLGTPQQIHMQQPQIQLQAQQQLQLHQQAQQQIQIQQQSQQILMQPQQQQQQQQQQQILIQQSPQPVQNATPTPVAPVVNQAVPAPPSTVNAKPPTPVSTASTPVTPKSAPKRTSSTENNETEAPPPKKSRSRAKPKKKVTLDLEQLLKQSGIMDEDLQDDGSFDFSFGFGTPNTQMNGLSDSIDSVLNDSMNCYETSNKTNGVDAGNNSLPSVHTTDSESPKKSQKKKSGNSINKMVSSPGTPLGNNKSRKKSGNSGITEVHTENNKKTEMNHNVNSSPVTTSSRRRSDNNVPKKNTTGDELFAIIDAVASGGARSPTPEKVSLPGTPRHKSGNSGGTKKPTTPVVAVKSSAPPIPKVPAPAISPVRPTTVSNPIPKITPHGILASPGGPVPQPPNAVVPGPNHPPPAAPPAVSVVTTQTAGPTRIVQTVQLTPQNNQLLRNIQAQINRLAMLPSRNITEQTAYEKLIVLQQQVIATGVPVPTPHHLNNVSC